MKKTVLEANRDLIRWALSKVARSIHVHSKGSNSRTVFTVLNCLVSNSDLDNISQADNGAQLSTGEVDISDSESEISQKEEDLDIDPPETPYVLITEEEFGAVGAQVKA